MISKENDTKRLLEEWKRGLKQGGACLEPEKKARFKHLTSSILDAMTEFQDNIWHDNRHVELSIGELEGLPTAYFATHSVTETTGKVLIFGKLANICPNLDYCRVQTTRAKVMRLTA